MKEQHENVALAQERIKLVFIWFLPEKSKNWKSGLILN